MTDKARDKISKLLNMTVANGCTEDEQETALRMAAAIATREGIELDSIRARDQTAAQRKATDKTLRQEFKVHQVLAAQAAAELYGVKIMTYNHGKGGIYFVGREENIELTEQTMFWLMRQVELLYKQNLERGLTQKARAEFRKTFKAACAYRVYQRAVELMRDMRTNSSEAIRSTGSTALVVQGYFETLRRENDTFLYGDPDENRRNSERIQQRERDRRNALTVQQREDEDQEYQRQQKKWEKQAAKRKGPRERKLPTGSGTQAGLRAGDSVKLRQEIK